MPCEAYIPLIAWTLFFDPVVASLFPTCLLVTISVSPRFAINPMILWLDIYSLISPIRII